MYRNYRGVISQLWVGGNQFLASYTKFSYATWKARFFASELHGCIMAIFSTEYGRCGRQHVAHYTTVSIILINLFSLFFESNCPLSSSFASCRIVSRKYIHISRARHLLSLRGFIHMNIKLICAWTKSKAVKRNEENLQSLRLRWKTTASVFIYDESWRRKSSLLFSDLN